MSSVDQACQTRLQNIRTKTSESLEELTAVFQQSGLTRHAEIRELLQRELGLSIKNLPEHPHRVSMPSGSMCNYKVNLTEASEVDEELITWIRQAYEAAGCL